MHLQNMGEVDGWLPSTRAETDPGKTVHIVSTVLATHPLPTSSLCMLPPFSGCLIPSCVFVPLTTCSFHYLLLTLTFHSWRLSDTRLSDMLVHTKVLVTVKVLFLFRLEICEIVYREQHSTQENRFLMEGLHTLKLSSTWMGPYCKVSTRAFRDPFKPWRVSDSFSLGPR